MRVLVTGATGYVGGRLAPLLVQRGWEVRCFTRHPDSLQGRPWATRTELAVGDVLDRESLERALQDVAVAVYLIHSLHAGERAFAEQDRHAARQFAELAAKCGVRRIVYLGGLKPSTGRPSPHLASRIETGEILRTSGVPTTELRAGVILGSGSLSFELIRYLTERIPVMVCPRWVRTRTQPIAIRDVLQYLVGAVERGDAAGGIFDIGGKDVLSYEALFRLYAKLRGLRRRVIKVPLLSPRLSSYWIGLVTPLPPHVGRLLIEGLRNEVVCRDQEARRFFGIEPLSAEEAMARALDRYRQHDVETTWFGAFSASGAVRQEVRLVRTEGMIVERREVLSPTSRPQLFAVIQQLGGERGWLYADRLWQVRGLFDLLVGGVGLRRGRRDPVQLSVGDVVDFWRVEAFEPNRLLRLRAEMKVPGRAWLQFEVEDASGGSRLIQTAFFEPRGLVGLLYWWGLLPVHRAIFRGMSRAIVRRAPREATGEMATP
ncbi:MAG: SDR family oxidoreductase [Acidobacteriota bacterium]